MISKHFLLSCQLSFPSADTQKFFSLMKSQFIYFSFTVCPFDARSKESAKSSIMKIIPYIFFREFYGLIFKFRVFFLTLDLSLDLS